MYLFIAPSISAIRNEQESSAHFINPTTFFLVLNKSLFTFRFYPTPKIFLSQTMSAYPFLKDTATGAERELSTVQKNNMNMINEQYGDKIQKLFRVQVGSRMDINPNTIGPHVQVVDVDAPMHSAVATMSTANGVTSITRIRNPNISDTFVREKLVPAISANMTALKKATTPELSASVERHFSGDASRDAAEWLPDLARGSIQICSQIVPGENGTERKVYHAIVTTHSSASIANSIKEVANTEGMTASRFHQDEAVKWTRNQSLRNNQRITQIVSESIAESLGEPSGINSRYDTAAFVPKHHLAPTVAVHDSIVRFNTSNTLTKPGETEPYAVAFYQNCADGAQSQYSTLVSGDYLHPIHEFHGAPIRSGSGELLGHPGDISNKFANALPILSNLNTRDAHIAIASSLTADMRSDLDNQISRPSVGDSLPISQLHGAFTKLTAAQVSDFMKNASAFGIDPHHPPTIYTPVATIL